MFASVTMITPAVLVVSVLLTVTLALPTAVVPILKPISDLAIVDLDLLEAIVVDAGETTTFQPPESFQSFDPSDCLLPKEKGPCRALLDAYFFNMVTNSCEHFSWSGCRGNANRFNTLEACDMSCKQATPGTTTETAQTVPTRESVAAPTTETARTIPTPETARTIPTPETAPTIPTPETVVAPGSNETVAAPIPIVKPKPTLPSCPKFTGCGPKCVIIQDRTDRGCKKCLCGDGNSSRPKLELPGPVVISSGNVTVSKTSQVSIGSVSGTPKDEVEEPITGEPSENCKLPTKRGHCRGMITRYHYDPTLKDCVIFHYGGCEGNSNNFVSKDKCLEYCQGQ